MRFLLLALLTVAVGSGTDSRASGSSAITVKQALTAKPGEAVVVRGALIVSGGIARLCYAVLESYPPQCGGPSLVLRELDLNTVGELTSANSVTWSDREVRLRGTVTDGTLTVG
ncbi:MAG TPA: hypothetical protein VN960_06160 [Gaiellaceae bacterium]|nr:hypothetical protein [Gaiellaceae bacterium]